VCDENTVKQLIEDLIGKNYGKQTQAYDSLIACGDVAVEPLIEILKRQNNGPVESRGALSVPNNPNDVVGVQNLFSAMMKAYQNFDASDGTIIEIVGILSQIGDERAIEPIIATLRTRTANMMTTGLITRSIERFGKKAVEPLIKLLDDPNPGTRTNAAIALSCVPDIRAIAPLLKLLPDENDGVRQAAVQALGRIRSSEATESIINLLKTDKINPVRQWAVMALGDLRDEKAVDALITAVENDPDSETRRLAAHSLRHYQGERVVKTLIRALFDKETIVPIWARYALNEMEEQARPYLKRLHEEQPELIERAYNTSPWEWVEASRSGQHDQLKAELEEMRGMSNPSTEEAKLAYARQAHNCPICGKAANELAWFFFSTPPKTWQDLMGHAGWMTVCDDCHIQVDFFGGIIS
jgi:HEAT repeat protein